jgi:hypothetical protein
VTNVGSAAASAALASVTLPAGMSVVSMPAPCTLSGSTVGCNVGAMGAGAQSASQIVVSSASAGTMTLNAAASSAESDSNAANNSASLTLTIDPAAAGRLVNIATRGKVLTGEDVMIAGFIIGGDTPKTVVVRARGPSLTSLGVPGALANPLLQLFAGQTQIAVNDNWQDAPNAVQLHASGFAPPSSPESAIMITLDPGAYSAIMSGVGGGTGIGLIEVFEVDHPEVPLVNIATRARVLTGDDVMIGGFIIQGDTPQTVVVRARGPSMRAQGVADPLANPVLQLFAGQTQLAVNDNWQDAPNAAQLQASGFAPADALESAILVTLQPGAYTAIVTGAGGGTGVGIVEVFAQ